MELTEGLTSLQKIALEGEVAFAISTAPHDAEAKYRIYAIFKEVEDEYKPWLIKAFKEAITFDEDIVDQLYFESLTNEVPVWLWVEKSIADIKEALRLSESSVSKAGAYRVEARKKIITSAFVNFARRALMVSPDASEQLFDEILNDKDLVFLEVPCFYLKSCCEEVRDSGTVQDKIPETLLDCCFDIRDMLSTRVETEALELLTKKKKRKSSLVTNPQDEPIHIESISIKTGMTDEEISELLSQKILETFQGLGTPTKKKKPKQHFRYVVNKVFNDTQISTSIKVCKTREEAEEFIEKVKQEYPDLLETCNFFISKEKINGR